MRDKRFVDFKEPESGAEAGASELKGDVRGTDYQLLHPATVGELRRFLEPFDDDCPLMAMNWGAFRYVLDGEGNGKVQYT